MFTTRNIYVKHVVQALLQPHLSLRVSQANLFHFSAKVSKIQINIWFNKKTSFLNYIP